MTFMIGFTVEVREVLKNWGMDYHSVYYSKEINDLIIDNHSRIQFGKGYRAIIRTAFMLVYLNTA